MRYMAQPLSLRLPDATVERLGARARRRSIAPRTLAQRYVEEGPRTDEHPLIRFVDGPAGRRARLLGSGLGGLPRRSRRDESSSGGEVELVDVVGDGRLESVELWAELCVGWYRVADLRQAGP